MHHPKPPNSLPIHSPPLWNNSIQSKIKSTKPQIAHQADWVSHGSRTRWRISGCCVCCSIGAECVRASIYMRAPTCTTLVVPIAVLIIRAALPSNCYLIWPCQIINWEHASARIQLHLSALPSLPHSCLCRCVLGAQINYIHVSWTAYARRRPHCVWWQSSELRAALGERHDHIIDNYYMVYGRVRKYPGFIEKSGRKVFWFFHQVLLKKNPGFSRVFFKSHCQCILELKISIQNINLIS